MTRISTCMGVVGAIAALGLAVPAFAGSQLAANAGLSAEAAAGMTLTEIAAVKFNADTRGDDQQTVKHVRGVTMSTRSASTPIEAFAQLIASAGLLPADAQGLSLTGIAAYKFDRDTDED